MTKVLSKYSAFISKKATVILHGTRNLALELDAKEAIPFHFSIFDKTSNVMVATNATARHK